MLREPAEIENFLLPPTYPVCFRFSDKARRYVGSKMFLGILALEQRIKREDSQAKLGGERI
jgi:hypothetical protein